MLLFNAARLFLMVIQSWNSKFEVERALYCLNDNSARAVFDFIKTSEICQNYTVITSVQEVEVPSTLLNELLVDIENIKNLLSQQFGFLVLRPIEGLNIYEQAVVPWLIAHSIGDTPGQNYNGDKLYIVNDVGGKMKDGFRYSRTNQGGSLHTDGVNVKKPFDYFLLHIINQCLFVGASMFVNGVTVYNCLKDHAPEVIEILSQDFLWEYKGVQANRYYQEPVVKLVDGVPMWRYLRNYLEEAAKKNGTHIPSERIWAMDCLDAILESCDFQCRYKLKKGETVFCNDRLIFHGRTSYADSLGRADFAQINKHRLTDTSFKRTGLRIWINASY